MRAFLSLLAVSLTLVTGVSGAAAAADYGDAPDGRSARYGTAPRADADFPSLRRSDGARHSKAGSLLLGVGVSGERESAQVDRDRKDDGFYPELARCRTSRLVFVVDASRLPLRLRKAGHTAYLNAWLDWNRDGDWRDTARCGRSRVREWRVKNARLDMASFEATPVQAVAVEVRGGPQVGELWTRASVTLDQRFTKPAMGAFRYGETEDDLFRARPLPPPDGEDFDSECVETDEDDDGNAVHLLMQHGDVGRMNFLVAPSDAPVTFTVSLPPEAARDLAVDPLPGGRGVEVEPLDEDGPRRLELYELEVTATGPNGKSQRFECRIAVYHGVIGTYATPQPRPPGDGGGGRRTERPVYVQLRVSCPGGSEVSTINGDTKTIVNPPPGGAATYTWTFTDVCKGSQSPSLVDAETGRSLSPFTRLFEPNTTFETITSREGSTIRVDVVVRNNAPP